MRSKIALGLVVLLINVSGTLAGSQIELSGPWPQSSGPHTPLQPDSRD
jgi:hypothetical protein